MSEEIRKNTEENENILPEPEQAEKKPARRARKVVRQKWVPPVVLEVLYRIWRVLFAAVKIAAGAAATVVLIAVIAGFVFAGMLGDFLQNDILPNAALDLDEVVVDLNSTIYYVDAQGQIQVQQKIDAQIDRQWVNYEDIPEAMIHAAIAVEDHRFYKHQGVDWITTLQACARMFFGDSSVGGSSITQQLVKNTFGSDSVTVQRKLLEIFQATQMEKKYDKKIILEYYLNIIYLGQNCNGIKTAAATYYGKELEKLNAAECASIIAITNNPNAFDPYQDKENNEDRTDKILWDMFEQGYLTREEFDIEKDRELVLKRGIDFEDTMAICPNENCDYKDIVSTLKVDENGLHYCPSCDTRMEVEEAPASMYSWHTEAVIKDVAKALAEKDGVEWNNATQELYMRRIQTGGYHIYSTMDIEVQKQVEEIYCNLENIPNVRGAQQLQSAIVVIDNRTGDIVGIAGGTGEKTDYFGWDRAQEERQSGSSIKPISVYGPAFESGLITPATVMKDMPLNYDDGNWPRNDNRVYNYTRTIYDAVTWSVNAACAWTLDGIGTDYSYDFAKNKFGISTLVDEYVDPSGTVHTDNNYAPLAMGAQTWGVTVRDMANAFATFPNYGVYREARTFTLVLDNEGNVVIDNEQRTERILSQKSADYMNLCLVNATHTGTGKGAIIKGMTTAGKTGTTTSNYDRWYCGFTGYYTAAVWTGFDQPEGINYSNNPASELFKKVLDPLHTGKEDMDLYHEDLMEKVVVCLDSGKLATKACYADVRETSRVRESWVYGEDYPTEYCDKHIQMDVCSSGHVANEYCTLFAERENQTEEDTVTVTKQSLVKMTQAELDAIKKASGYGLAGFAQGTDWVYRIYDSGAATESAYKECEEHTLEAWEEYLASQVPEEPVDPDNPTEPVPPGGDGSSVLPDVPFIPVVPGA